MIVTVIAICVFVAHDVHVYINGGRPWSATIDGICGIFFTPKRNCVVLKVPVENERIKVKVSHKWRGNYQFRLWVPETDDGRPPSIEQIGLAWRFEDGGSPINIGFFNRPIGNNNPGLDDFYFQNKYIPIDGSYNDCVMREAVKNVTPNPYQLATREGRSSGQYNCQDYADDLRYEYYRLLLDLKIRCRCNLK